MIAVISSENKISQLLEKEGFSVLSLQYESVPSLTGLLLDHPDITDLVIRDTDPAPWSAAHVMSTAKYLLSRGSTVILGSKGLAEACTACGIITVTEEIDALPALLRKPKDGNKFHPAGGTVRPHIEEKKTPRRLQPDPLEIPRDKVVYIGVVGSQPRIGCTTQAVSLWHYCKALGFSPAIVAGAAQIAGIAGVMESTPIDQGYIIEEIPFVSDTALSYDCYILDIGTEISPELLAMSDLLILVAGSKPWELLQTTAAARSLEGQGMCVLLSFSSAKDAGALQPLFAGSPCAAAAWIPDLWKPSAQSFSIYEELLRPAMEKVLAGKTQELTPLFGP